MSSNRALQRVKRAFEAEKAGHTGSLDPMATGVLPICLGEATKYSQYLLNADKSYTSTFSLGIKTDTGDSEGKVISVKETKGLNLADVRDAVEGFLGQVSQVPPMYSAIKKQGKPLYKLARQGIYIDREARTVHIRRIKIDSFRKKSTSTLDVDISCSKGTYIRTIAEDLGSILGCGAHVSRLDRYSVGPFHERDAISLDELEKISESGNRELLDPLLYPVDAALMDYPRINLDAPQTRGFANGQSVLLSKSFITGQEADIVRVFDNNQNFIGVAEITSDNSIKPKRLIAK
tara:strand:+ start:757 stop:1629 length:873 start_codon:yes stop_codon:yes gene_type:complete